MTVSYHLSPGAAGAATPSKLVQTLRVGGWPNSVLARRNDSIGIKGVFDGLVESHEDIIVPVVGFRNLIHDCQVSAILAPAVRCTISNQCLDKPVCSFLGVGVFAIKNNAYNVVCRRLAVCLS